MFIGPHELDSEWSDRGIEGVYKFLRRLWDWTISADGRTSSSEPQDFTRQLHILIKNVTERLEGFRFNTAISVFMEFINFAFSENMRNMPVKLESVEKVIVLISPFAPHLAEELWEKIGHKDSVFKASWPVYNEKLTEVENIEVPVQVNGKLRATLEVAKSITEEDIIKLALERENVKKFTTGKTILKKIYVPEKIVNIVVK